MSVITSIFLLFFIEAPVVQVVTRILCASRNELSWNCMCFLHHTIIPTNINTIQIGKGEWRRTVFARECETKRIPAECPGYRDLSKIWRIVTRFRNWIRSRHPWRMLDEGARRMPVSNLFVLFSLVLVYYSIVTWMGIRVVLKQTWNDDPRSGLITSVECPISTIFPCIQSFSPFPSLWADRI
jgi:hypothetical protein